MSLIEKDTLMHNWQEKICYGVRCVDCPMLGEGSRCKIEEYFNDQPIIDAVEVKHGDWNQIEIIDDDSENGVNDDASQCYVCGYVFDSHYLAKTYFNYCPNCGARMKGEQE